MNKGSSRPKLVLITGLSGSGKSTVAKCFEDLGYYCVDNLPLPLLHRFLRDPLSLARSDGGIAVVTDVRAPGFAEEFPKLVSAIDRAQVDPVLLFLEASEETLVRRFSETRRSHPLAVKQPLIEGIRREREILVDLRGSADRIFDTSEWTIHETRHQVYREFGTASGDEPHLTVNLVSFGFKYGIPYGTDLLFDVRFLPNPHFEESLREFTGQDREVQDFLRGKAEFNDFLGRLEDFLRYLLPKYYREHRSYLSIGIGCTGGKHRSVAAVEELGRRFGSAQWPVQINHRDLAR